MPHFEKMLYDNAQLASVHLAAFEITGDPRCREEALATFTFIEHRMTAPEGGFFSALDAETHAEEGAYYVWTSAEVKSVLGEGRDADLFTATYGLTESRISRGADTFSTNRGRGPSKPEHWRSRPPSWKRRLRPLRSGYWPRATSGPRLCAMTRS